MSSSRFVEYFEEFRFCNRATVTAYKTKAMRESFRLNLNSTGWMKSNQNQNVALILDHLGLRTARSLVGNGIVLKSNIYSPNKSKDVCDSNLEWGIIPFKGMMSECIQDLNQKRISPNIVVFDGMTNLDGSKENGYPIEDIYEILKNNTREWLILEVTFSKRNRHGNFTEESQFETAKDSLESSIFPGTQWRFEFTEGSLVGSVFYLTYILHKDLTIDSDNVEFKYVDERGVRRWVGFSPGYNDMYVKQKEKSGLKRKRSYPQKNI